MYYLVDFANFSEITDEDRARSRKYGRRGALIGGSISALRNAQALSSLPLGVGTKAGIIGGAAALDAGVGYLIGKGISRLKRGDTTNTKGRKRRNRKAEYNQNTKYALFKSNQEPVKQKRNWLRTGAKIATVGALGLGAGAAGMGGLIHLSNKQLKKTGEANIKSKVKSAFDTLGIGETGNVKDIKRAYRKVAKTAHPDMPTGNRDLFQKVNDAYEYAKPDGTGRMKDLSDLNKQQDLYKKARNFYLKGGAKIGGAGLVGVGGLALTRPKKEEKPQNRLERFKARYFNR